MRTELQILMVQPARLATQTENISAPVYLKLRIVLRATNSNWLLSSVVGLCYTIGFDSGNKVIEVCLKSENTLPVPIIEPEISENHPFYKKKRMS